MPEVTLESAKRFMEETNRGHVQTGWVWFWDGLPCGWSCAPDPATFEPGCEFVNVETGEKKRAIGGTVQDGAVGFEAM